MQEKHHSKGKKGKVANKKPSASAKTGVPAAKPAARASLVPNSGPRNSIISPNQTANQLSDSSLNASIAKDSAKESTKSPDMQKRDSQAAELDGVVNENQNHTLHTVEEKDERTKTL